MTNQDIQFLTNMLYNEDLKLVKDEVGKIEDPILLHTFSANYNWNNGYEIPKEIISNKYCDFGTGLLVFYYSDGYTFLDSKDETLNHSDEIWEWFIQDLYTKLLNDNFVTKQISYTPPLTRVQTYKLKKSSPNIPDKILVRSPGEEIEIPII